MELTKKPKHQKINYEDGLNEVSKLLISLSFYVCLNIEINVKLCFDTYTGLQLYCMHAINRTL